MSTLLLPWLIARNQRYERSCKRYCENCASEHENADVIHMIYQSKSRLQSSGWMEPIYRRKDPLPCFRRTTGKRTAGTTQLRPIQILTSQNRSCSLMCPQLAVLYSERNFRDAITFFGTIEFSIRLTSLAFDSPSKIPQYVCTIQPCFGGSDSEAGN